MGRVFRVAQRVLAFAGIFMCTLSLLTGTLCAQNAFPIRPPSPPPSPSVAHAGVPVDWSTQHVIYTRNGSLEDMMKVRDDPRFRNSILLHNLSERSKGTGLAGSGELKHVKNRHSKVDWAVSLGHHAGMAIGESPAKFSFDPNAPPSCSDFIVYTIDATPDAHVQANLIGLTNLYSGTDPTGICGTGPEFLFSYAIGTGPSGLSPVLSLDGTKIAWIETPADTPAIFHVTTWAKGTGQGSNATNGAVAVNGASSDIAIDYTSFGYGGGCVATPSTNTNADLYVDYSSDTGYLAADNGILYHISSVFTGTPTFDFCTMVNPVANSMSGAVYDSLLNEVFISDARTLYAYNVGPGSFTLLSSISYANSPISGPGPILDAFNGFIYMFTGNDLATPPHTSMTQMPVNLASAAVVPLGPSSGFTVFPVLFYGAVDNTYLNDGPFNAASTLYTCGTDFVTPDSQDLFAINFNPTTGVANTAPIMSFNGNVNPGNGPGICSPITEFFDGSTDRIFVGMGDSNGTDGANAVTMWDVTTQLNNTSGPGGTLPTPTATASPYLGGTTGITIDNNASGVAQAESIYFSTLIADPSTGVTTCNPNHFCAVKLTQSGLQ
jgi:hypothetical protein